ncbi:uncharacterized protein LOC124551345 [Schistocerca americana]|uniref:uncharacterized protein LOC124551345 n=1 Tax=Schistocerca americana TaxID=7009 RepID=UPI001F4F7AC1|nr:uncharacterized protein LOC124551345 [Schistocerca americana]
MGDSDDGARRKGHGFRYEELVIVLVFLRCVRKQLSDFAIHSDSLDAGKFDDVVVTWNGSQDKHSLLVQVKHKTSGVIRRGDLFSEGDNKPDFNIRRYEASYRTIKWGLGGRQYALVISTNLALHENALDCFCVRQAKSVVGADLLHTGGSIYQLNPKEVTFDSDFMNHFFMFCSQKGVNEMRDAICAELKQLLGSPGDDKINNAFEELCKCVEKWKDRQCKNPERLTSSWSEWEDIENRYKSSLCTIL